MVHLKFVLKNVFCKCNILSRESRQCWPVHYGTVFDLCLLLPWVKGKSASSLLSPPGPTRKVGHDGRNLIWVLLVNKIDIKRVIVMIIILIGLVGDWLQTFLATLWHSPGLKWSFWVYRNDVEAQSALCLLVLPQMIWQGRHWSQHLRMPGLLTLCTPLNWLQASLMQPSLTQQLLPLPRPCTPRWGTNRCVYLLPSLLPPHPRLQ